MPGEIIGAVGSLIGGSASKKAAKTEAAAAMHAADLQMQQFQQVQTEEAPFIQSGNAALQALMGGLGFTQNTAAGNAASPQASQLAWLQANTGPETQAMIQHYLADPANAGKTPQQQLQELQAAGLGPKDQKKFSDFLLSPAGSSPVTGTGGWSYGGPGDLSKPFDPTMLENTPGYKFTLNQGLDAIGNYASAHGGIQGGNTLKAITDYAEGLAGTTYQTQLQDYMAQQNQRFNQLDTLAGSGQNAVANLGALGANAASNAGNAIIGAGNANAAGIIGQANGVTGALSQFGSLFGGGGGSSNALMALFGGGAL